MITYGDWITSNFSDVAKGNADQFEVKYMPYAFRKMPFMDAAEYTANLIRNRYKDRQLYIGLSGGADSEFVVRLFNRLNIPFTPIIIKTDINRDEVDIAIGLCAELSLTPFVVRTTAKAMIDYYMQKVYPLRSDGLNHVHQLMVIDKAIQLDGVPILGETHVYDPDPAISIVRAFKFLPDVLYDEDVIPFFYYTLELTFAELNASIRIYDAQEFKSKVRGTKFRMKMYPAYSTEDRITIDLLLHTLKPDWLYCDMGNVIKFIEQMEKYSYEKQHNLQ